MLCSLRHTPIYLYVHFRFYDFSEKVVDRILKSEPSFKQLSLSSIQISLKEVGSICEALRLNTSLRKLDLSLNSIGNEGAQLLCDALKFNTSLEILDLVSTGIGNDFIKIIEHSLEVNRSPEILTVELEEKQWRRISMLGLKWKPDKAIHILFPKSFQKKVFYFLVYFFLFILR